MNKRTLAGTLVLTLALAGCAERSAQPRDGESPSDPAAQVLERIGSPRVASLSTDGTVATVEGHASDGEADLTRTLWFENVAAAAYAQLVSVDSVIRSVLDDDGKVLGQEEDPVSEGTQDAFASPADTADDIASLVSPGAESLDVKVVAIEYIELFGGIAEVVVQPSDVESFIASAGENVPMLLDSLSQNQRPYLVTVVDQDQVPQLVLGYTPGVGGDGQGLAWIAPGLETDAIWGTPIPDDIVEEEGE